mmetsp:Transcript_51552/g.104944  ORF Transcript_51552/g.104944 Transcript_51552/m.104944 type:complete len:115 (-) Transcript_51552:21-365(-)
MVSVKGGGRSKTGGPRAHAITLQDMAHSNACHHTQDMGTQQRMSSHTGHGTQQPTGVVPRRGARRARVKQCESEAVREHALAKAMEKDEGRGGSERGSGVWAGGCGGAHLYSVW